MENPHHQTQSPQEKKMENPNKDTLQEELHDRVKEETEKMKRSFELQMEDKDSTQQRRLLKESLDQLSQERDDLREMLNTQKEEAYLEVLELEKRNCESFAELQQLRRERDGLLEEKKERERRFERMMEESSSIISSLLVVQMDLEERMERKRKDAQMFLKSALSMVKETERVVRRWEDDGEEEKGGDGGGAKREEESGGEEMIRSVGVELEGIRKIFRQKEEKMKDLKRKIELLEGSFVEEKEKKVRL